MRNLEHAPGWQRIIPLTLAINGPAAMREAAQGPQTSISYRALYREESDALSGFELPRATEKEINSASTSWSTTLRRPLIRNLEQMSQSLLHEPLGPSCARSQLDRPLAVADLDRFFRGSNHQS
jgi:hypothetical protein